MQPDQIFLEVNYRKVSLARLLEMDRSTVAQVWVDNCPGLAALPELPAATDVWVYNCASIVNFIRAGKDSRGYEFIGVKLMGQWRVIAGCRNYNMADASAHWGPGGSSDRPDCLALVEQIAAAIKAIEDPTTSMTEVAHAAE
jgi:hypothetical protein